MTKDKIISGLEMTMGLFLFDPSTGETCEPDNLNELDRITYDACKGAVELLQTEPHWIPVTERLPEDDTVVLVCGKRGGVYTAIHNNSKTWIRGWWKMNSKNHNCNPIAWMPLPEPWKEE